ncbi:hypothetical protein DEU56DRAFT_805316, partial [Suillus clintonianus]|uniref:uncharacterized protein n=1 Tax=Suillus clintonianus TaxID=1904413 RepID=UPI001B87F350
MSALVDVDTLTVEQMTALVAQLEAKKKEAVARQRAEEDAKRKEEEALRKAAEKKRAEAEERKRVEAEERKRVEGDKKKTGAESSVRCTACIKANAECTSSAASRRIRVTSCDRCRATKSACTFCGKAEKTKRKKRADTDSEEDEAESSRGDRKRSRQPFKLGFQLPPPSTPAQAALPAGRVQQPFNLGFQLFPPSTPARQGLSLMEAEDEVDERGLVVAALEVLADKIGQVSEELAANRKMQQKMVTVLDNIFRTMESRKEVDQLASVKF